ncbi:hypothetical protein V1517DRAFT_314780, partial [Lipomyces orientalis]
MRLRELLKLFNGRRDPVYHGDKDFLSPNTTIIPYTSLFTEGLSDSDANRYRSRLWDPSSLSPHPGLDTYRCYYSSSEDAQLARLDVNAQRLTFAERWRTRRVRKCRRRKAKFVSEIVIDFSEELTHWRRRLQELIDGAWTMDTSRVDRTLNKLRQLSLTSRDRNKSRSRRLRNSVSFYAETLPQSEPKSPFDDPSFDDAREDMRRESSCGENRQRRASSCIDTDPFRPCVLTTMTAQFDVQEESSTLPPDAQQQEDRWPDSAIQTVSLTGSRMINRDDKIYVRDPDVVTVNNIYAILDEFTGPNNSDDENEATWLFRNASAHARGSFCEYCAALRMKVRCITEWTVKAERYVAAFTDTYPKASDSDATKAGVVRAANEVRSALRRHKEKARKEQETRLWNSQIHERARVFHFEMPPTPLVSDHAGPVYTF